MKKYIPVLGLVALGIGAEIGQVSLAFAPPTDFTRTVADTMGQALIASVIAIAALVRGIGGPEDEVKNTQGDNE